MRPIKGKDHETVKLTWAKTINKIMKTDTEIQIVQSGYKHEYTDDNTSMQNEVE